MVGYYVNLSRKCVHQASVFEEFDTIKQIMRLFPSTIACKIFIGFSKWFAMILIRSGTIIQDEDPV